MAQYDETNRGSIWKNDKKQSDKHPDFRGTLNVDGVEYWVSAWKRKEGANPKAPALTFAVQPKEQQPPAAAGDSGGAGEFSPDEFDSDIPF